MVSPNNQTQNQNQPQNYNAYHDNHNQNNQNHNRNRNRNPDGNRNLQPLELPRLQRQHAREFTYLNDIAFNMNEHINLDIFPWIYTTNPIDYMDASMNNIYIEPPVDIFNTLGQSNQNNLPQQ